jgi:hypothetical protein
MIFPAVLLLAMASAVAVRPSVAAAYSPIPVSVTIPRVIQVEDPDGLLLGDPDYYARVTIDGYEAESSVVTGADIQPFWVFTTEVDRNLLEVLIVIELFDEDVLTPDDVIDIDPTDDDTSLSFILDLYTGEWGGELPANQGWAQGDGDEEHVTDGGEAGRIFFDFALSSNGDIDEDGIPDGVERFGVLDANGTLVADMAALGADPCRKTIAVEIDFMDGAADGHTHRPKAAAIAEVVDAFDAAPVPATTDCPYVGFPLKAEGVDLIVDVDNSITEQPVLGFGTQFDTIRTNNFTPGRELYFKYSLWVHDINTVGSSGGCCSQGAFIVSLGRKAGGTGTVREQSGTFMHELGHQIGLKHGGIDDILYKPNYLSVMNYRYQMLGLLDDVTRAWEIDYSRSELDSLNETALDETVGINGGTLWTHWMDLSWSLVGGPGNGPLDWTGDDADGNGTTDDDTGVTVDINGDGICVVGRGTDGLNSTRLGDDVIIGQNIHDGADRTCDSSASGNDTQERTVGHVQPATLDGFNDWANIQYLTAMSAPGGGINILFDEPSFEEEQKIEAFWVELLTAPPIVDAGPDAVIHEGDTFVSSGSFDDPGADTWTATVDYGDGTGTQALPLVGKSFSLDHLYGDDGVYTVTVTVTDNGGGVGIDTATVTVPNAPPEVTNDTPSIAVQYSDEIPQVVITAVDVWDDELTLSPSWRLSGGTFTDGLPGSLALSQPVCLGSDGRRTCTWMLSGPLHLPESVSMVRLRVDDGDGGEAQSDILIPAEAEAADVWFEEDNPVAVEVAGAGGDSGAFTLTAYVKETTPDEPPASAAPGNIDRADLSMTLVPVGPGGLASPTEPCSSVVTGTGYDAVKAVTCTFDEVEVNTYTLDVDVTGGFYSGGSEDVLVVHDPSLGFTTGGGWFYWPGTDEKTNFGYTMKHNKKGQKVQGSFLLIRHLPDDTKYRIKSNALYGLAIGDDPSVPMGWASFSGKATYLEPGWLEPIGNHEFVAYVEDHDEPGVGVDQIWLEMHDKDGNVIPALSMPRDAIDNTQPISGGNIVVPQ